VLAGRLRRPVVGGDDEEPVVELLADEPADRRSEPRLVANRVDKRDQSIGLLDDLRAVGLTVRVVHPDRLVAVIVEAVHGVREVSGESAFDLVGLDVEEAARAALSVVGSAGDEGPDERRLPVIDVAGRADNEVVVVRLEHPALAEGGEADQPFRVPVAGGTGAPRLDVGDVGICLVG